MAGVHAPLSVEVGTIWCIAQRGLAEWAAIVASFEESVAYAALPERTQIGL
jgi:hypothetical protein